MRIGADIAVETGEFWTGNIAEVVVYTANVSASDQQKIDSYLALKYGISLDQTDATDYLASDGTAIWEAANNTGYTTDIFGIGCDDASGLNQKVSKSANDGSILTLALDADFTSANNDASRTTEHASDLQFLMVADNGAALTTQTTELEAASGFNVRLAREWKVDATNFAQNVSMKFNGYDENWSLIATANGDFSSGVTVIGALNANGELPTTTPPTDGMVFTLAKFQKAPGGIPSDLTLWVKADAGVTTDTGSSLDQWSDQSVNDFVFVDDDGNAGPDLVSGATDQAFNFNDYLSFGAGGTRSLRDATAHGLVGSDAATLFAVFNKSGGFQAVFSAKGAAGDITQLNVGGGYLDDNPFGEFIPSTDPPDDKTILVGLRDDTPSDGEQEGIFNGAIALDNNLTSPTSNSFSNDVAKIGTDDTNSFTGKLAEVVVYQSKLSNADVQKVSSYLALKYGITLDQTSPLDYLASDGSTIWRASDNTGYTTDIFGIGRDDASGLNKKYPNRSMPEVF